MLDHSLPHTKVDGLSPATTRDNGEKKFMKSTAKIKKVTTAYTNEACIVQNLPFWARSYGTVVDHSLHHPKVEGLSPAMAACTVRESAENSS